MHDDSRLPRRLGLGSALAVLVGSVIGSGIFRSPAVIADRLPGPVPMLAAWVAGGLFALCGALTLAEIASALPRTGGLYVFIREGWGRVYGFLFGWAQLAVIRAAALGAISTTFAEYFLRVLGYDPGLEPYASWVHYVAAVAIIITAGFNIRGVRWGAMVQNVTTLAKYGALVFIVLVAFTVGAMRMDLAANLTPAMPAGSFRLPMFGLALVSVLWVLDGWADLSYVAGEVKEPRKNLPRALILGVLLVIGIYLLVNIAYLAVLGIEGMRGSPLVAAEVASQLIGPAGVIFVSLTVMVSTFGTLNGVLLTNPRIFFALAADKLFFRKVAAVHPRYETPYVAVALAASLGVVWVLMLNFEQLADAFVTAILPFYALGVSAIFFLRRRADYQPSFRVPLYPVVPIAFILAVIFLLGNAILDVSSRWATIGTLGLVALGVPVYFLTVGRGKNK
ncbi:MAG TPA: amino acid permease [Gemmatimonadaceae bacterium]|nr:amino acid permease [Gemmatimonadaceae bacterium]